MINISENKTLKIWVFISIPLLFILGACFHFLYHWSGNVKIIGAISAVNESVWEHTKLLLVPILSWWIIFFITKRERYNISTSKWFTGMLTSVVTSVFVTMLVYYFYTEAFGKELIIVDILITLLAVGVAQLLGYHVYKHTKGLTTFTTVILVLAILYIYIIWTFNPPHLPLFYDKASGKYGI